MIHTADCEARRREHNDHTVCPCTCHVPKHIHTRGEGPDFRCTGCGRQLMWGNRSNRWVIAR